MVAKNTKPASKKETPTTEPQWFTRSSRGKAKSIGNGDPVQVFKRGSGPLKNPDYGDTGYPEKDIKTSGIKIRGTGAATKGVMARGPMA